MSDLNYEIPDFDPVESKRKYDLEIKKRRKQYPIPLSEKNRNEILRRCEILKYWGDDGIMSDYYESTDQELVDRYRSTFIYLLSWRQAPAPVAIR